MHGGVEDGTLPPAVVSGQSGFPVLVETAGGGGRYL